jgi:hypothetical protein
MREREVGALLEAMTWCEMHRATVTWTNDVERACRVEVLAPGSHWQLLRGVGGTLVDAYRACRASWEAESMRPAWHPAALVG